ncbi:hypothetical protein ALQ04_03808 [Pseudomonas cichorii]|uniref:Uncharacterized protein n=1 Tax=Pseudomonas cichorii TaxID=36746 RepID=A0A3M4MA64_PSECI|nr:hypothetical protein [Pseudomonas cichorii]RMQ50595.1 hypothetical protein ALQ04_03808 [Pseudomonas cichorii]
MLKSELLAFAEESINAAAQAIIDKKSLGLDDIAQGKLSAFLALRRVLQTKGTLQDQGMFDAINDVLQFLEILKSNDTFLGRAE